MTAVAMKVQVLLVLLLVATRKLTVASDQNYQLFYSKKLCIFCSNDTALIYQKQEICSLKVTRM